MTAKPRTVAFSRDAANVFFHILTGCNLRCHHCYINPAQHGSQTLPIETIERWLQVLAQRSPAANVIFLGGEPTMHPDLPAAVHVARKLGYQSVTIDTNGYLFHDILKKVTPAQVDFFSFSLDGASAETNDALRGKGCYEHCTAGIRKAVAAGFRTSLIYTVSARNLDELARMPDLVAELGIERFFIQVIGLRGQSSEQADDLLVTRRQWLEQVPPVARQVAQSGIHVIYPKVYLQPDEPFECAGNVADNYFVFPNGRVYRCPLCEDYPVHSLQFNDNRLEATGAINEKDLFALEIAEGCVMNRIVQPGNIERNSTGRPQFKIACCLLKEEISASQEK